MSENEKPCEVCGRDWEALSAKLTEQGRELEKAKDIIRQQSLVLDPSENFGTELIQRAEQAESQLAAIKKDRDDWKECAEQMSDCLSIMAKDREGLLVKLADERQRYEAQLADSEAKAARVIASQSSEIAAERQARERAEARSERLFDEIRKLHSEKPYAINTLFGVQIDSFVPFLRAIEENGAESFNLVFERIAALEKKLADQEAGAKLVLSDCMKRWEEAIALCDEYKKKLAEREAEYQDVLAVAKHVHHARYAVSGPNTGRLLDSCGQCGLDLRHDIHKRAECESRGRGG